MEVAAMFHTCCKDRCLRFDAKETKNFKFDLLHKRCRHVCADCKDAFEERKAAYQALHR